MNNYKLIATDFDGTLLDDDKKVSLANINSLKKCRDNGYYVVGVTARTSQSVFSVADSSLFDYFILNNGTHVYDVSKKMLSAVALISVEDYSLIFEEMRLLCKEIDFCSGNLYYVYGNDTVRKSFIKNINGLSEINGDIGRMNLFLLEPDKLDYWCTIINDKYKNISCFIMQDSDSDYKWLVLLPKGFSKLSTLTELGKNLGVSLDQMIFFGDGPNDIEVIGGVGCGVAMENAINMVKDKAKMVTLSNNDSGVSYFIEKKLF